jgi:hypothetical protein
MVPTLHIKHHSGGWNKRQWLLRLARAVRVVCQA